VEPLLNAANASHLAVPLLLPLLNLLAHLRTGLMQPSHPAVPYRVCRT
jgi:hypothetical protein